MIREQMANPHFPSRPHMAITLTHPPMAEEFDLVVPGVPPAGFHNACWRDERGRVCIGLLPDVGVLPRPVTLAAGAVVRGLAEKTMAELKTLAAMKSVKYTDKTTREDLIAELQAKGVKG